MRVLVTGGAGYIGSVMTRMLAGDGHQVMVLDDLSTGHRQALDSSGLTVADLRDARSTVETCLRFKPEGCMHFASRSLVGESMSRPLWYFENNLGGALNLARGLVESGCGWIVFSSSAAAFGIPESLPLTEDSPTAPINPYGISKVVVEQMLGELDRVGDLRFVSLRYFNAAGADVESDLGEDHVPETHLIPNVIYAALGRSEGVSVFGTDYPTPDGTCIRDYIHVIDLCRAHMLAMERLSSGGASGIFNLGNGNGFSVRQVIESVREASGRDFPVMETERRAGDPPVLVASSERLKSELGWSPEFDELGSMVESAWTWHSRHPDGY